MHTQTIYLDMTPGKVNPIVNLSQYDTGAMSLQFILVENGVVLPASSGTTALLNGLKPDETAFSYTGSISGSSYRFNCTDQMTNVAGDVLCELSLTNNEGIVGTANFIMRIEAAPLLRASASQNEIASISRLVSQAQGYASDAAESAALLDSYTAIENVTGEYANLNHYTSTGRYYFRYSIATNENSQKFPRRKEWDSTANDWVDGSTAFAGWLVVYRADFSENVRYVKQIYYAHGALNENDFLVWVRTFRRELTANPPLTDAWSDWVQLLPQNMLANTLSDSNRKIPTLHLVQVAQDTANNKCPKLHRDSEGNYGVASTTLYGHVKIVRNLDQTEYQPGYALSAEQGSVIKQRFVALENLMPRTPGNAMTKNHQSSDTDYGVGNQSSYGHVKIVANLNKDQYEQGYALSAEQGYILNNKITANIDNISNLITRVNVFDNATLMSDRASLNALGYGIYYCNDANVCKTLTYRPSGVTGAFTLYVDKYGFTGKRQILIQPSDHSIYYRVRTYNAETENDAWQDWYKLTGTHVSYIENVNN